MTEEAHHRVGRAANPGIRGCRVLCNRLRTNSIRGSNRIHQAVVAAIDTGVFLVARDEQKCPTIAVRIHRPERNFATIVDIASFGHQQV